MNKDNVTFLDKMNKECKKIKEVSEHVQQTIKFLEHVIEEIKQDNYGAFYFVYVDKENNSGEVIASTTTSNSVFLHHRLTEAVKKASKLIDENEMSNT